MSRLTQLLNWDQGFSQGHLQPLTDPTIGANPGTGPALGCGGEPLCGYSPRIRSLESQNAHSFVDSAHNKLRDLSQVGGEHEVPVAATGGRREPTLA